MGLEEQILDSWNIHNHINQYLLDAIPPAALSAVSASIRPALSIPSSSLSQSQLVSSWLRKLHQIL